MNAVIKPWLIVGLVGALAGNVLLSGILIVKLSRFDDLKGWAEEAEADVVTRRAELAKLQVEVDSLTKQKNALTTTIADWQQRLTEKAAAEAVLATLDAKQRQMESDIAQVGKRREDANNGILEAQKQKSDLASSIERLKAERDALTKSNSDIKALNRQAEEQERRLNAATNALANLDARRKQFEADGSAAQMRLEQIQKEADELRQAREKMSNDLATLRQQIQAQKDQLALFDERAADFRALQTAIQQEEQKLANLRQQSGTAEARVSEMAKATLQRPDADLAEARTKTQVFSAKQGELVRDVSRLEAEVERLKKDKEGLEKEIGRLEAQRPEAAPEVGSNRPSS